MWYHSWGQVNGLPSAREVYECQRARCVQSSSDMIKRQLPLWCYPEEIGNIIDSTGCCELGDYVQLRVEERAYVRIRST